MFHEFIYELQNSGAPRFQMERAGELVTVNDVFLKETLRILPLLLQLFMDLLMKLSMLILILQSVHSGSMLILILLLNYMVLLMI